VREAFGVMVGSMSPLVIWRVVFLYTGLLGVSSRYRVAQAGIQL